MTGKLPERRTAEPADGRRWHIPPAVLGLTGLTGPEGLVILEEVEGGLGALLWRTFRTVATRAGVEGKPDAARASELAARRGWIEALDLPPEIGDPLCTLASVDGIADPASAGEAAGVIGRWATAARHVRTGAEFHQLACAVRPSDATLALEAAKATRDLADYARAEVWLQRAIGLSRRAGEWRVYIEAHLAYGKLLQRRGNLPGARRWVVRALRRANRQGLRLHQARAYHDLFVIAWERERFDEAEVLAEKAFDAYPHGDRGRLWLSHDLAVAWMHRGAREAALRTFRALEPAMPPHKRPYILGNLARLAGSLAEGEVLDRARADLADLTSHSSVPGLSEAWVEVGRGALELGRRDEAEAAAREALRVATERREHRIEFLIEDLRADIQRNLDRSVAPAIVWVEPRNPALPDAVIEAVANFAKG